MRRVTLVVLALALAAGAAPRAGTPIPLLDLRPGFSKGGKLYRNRTREKPGLFLKGKRCRGLNAAVPSRAGFDLDGSFLRFRVRVGALDGSEDPVRFRILGDGRVLAATPPLFAGAEPLVLDVGVERVLLLELVTEGESDARAAWVDGELVPLRDHDLTRFRSLEAPFSPKDYPTAFRRRVNEAIDRGVAFLRSRQNADGGWPGPGRHHPLGVTALNTLAMLKAGVKPTDPSMVKAFAFMRKQPLDHTYSVSILLMALEARYFPGGADEKDAYRERPKLAKKLISAEEQTWIRDAAHWLVEQQGEGQFPVWRYPRGAYDLSNTQYALFGLSAANRCGVPTSRVWLPVVRFLIAAQEKGGPELQVSRYVRDGAYLHRKRERARARGFGYVLESEPTGSMTSAGLCSLILCQQALHRSGAFKRDYSKRTRTAIRDALAWLEEYYDITENPFRGGAWWTYYLYNIERAGVLLDMRFIGTRDWYQEGSEELMSIQNRNGSFAGGLVNTAFALLFLKRATVPAMTSPLK
jgi:hypothetical protein